MFLRNILARMARRSALGAFLGANLSRPLSGEPPIGAAMCFIGISSNDFERYVIAKSTLNARPCRAVVVLCWWPSSLELPIRSDVVGTSSSGICDSKVSPRGFAPIAACCWCAPAGDTWVGGTAMVGNRTPPRGLDRPYPLSLYIRGWKIPLS